jgi:hypothetical protein
VWVAAIPVRSRPIETRHRIREKGMIFMFAGVVRLGAFRPAFDRESYTWDATERKNKIGSSLNLEKKLALELKVAEKGKKSTRRNHIRYRSGDHGDMDFDQATPRSVYSGASGVSSRSKLLQMVRQTDCFARAAQSVLSRSGNATTLLKAST